MKAVMNSVLIAAGTAYAVTGAETLRKPEIASAADGRYRVSFSVPAAGIGSGGARDVAVSVVEGPGRGRVVRHLAAGVLGASAPQPFKAGAMEQVLEWDGTDDWGKPVGPGTYRARVSSGMGAEFDRFVGDEPQRIGSVNALAVGPAGEVYVYDGGQVVVLDREGRYRRQIKPYPAELPDAKLAGLSPATLADGTRFIRRDYPWGKWADSTIGSMAVSPDGQTLYMPGPPRYARNLIRIGTDGSVPRGAFDTKLTTLSDNGWLHLACSPDGKTLYMAGAMTGYRGDDARNLTFRHTIYRLRLDGEGPAEGWVGDDENGASKRFSVGKPKGLAVDRSGNVYVCNYDNNDVAVYTPGGGFLRRHAVNQPQQVAVNPKTGHMYVLRGVESGRYKYGYHFPETMQEASLVHMGADGSVMAELILDPLNPVTRKTGPDGASVTKPEFDVRMAADFSDASKPVVWVGVASPSAGGSAWGLLRIEDLGDRFGEPRDVCLHGQGNIRGIMTRMCLDRDRDVLYMGRESSKLYRFNALDGSPMEYFNLLDDAGNKGGPVMVEPAVGPDGMVYFTGWSKSYSEGKIYRADPGGKIVPFQAGTPGVGVILKSSAAESARGFAVSRAGEMFVLYYEQDRPAETEPAEPWDRCSEFTTAMAKFNADGSVADMRFVRYLRSGANGVRVNSRGEIFVADNFMPVGVAYPPDIAAVMGVNPLQRPYPARLDDASFDQLLRWTGSLFKFGPAGGRITGLPEDASIPASVKNPLDLYRPVPENQWFLHNLHRLRVTGAEWQFHGISPIPAEYQGVTHVERCVCRSGRFDIDPFDRVFVPDIFRHRFTVLDSAGNLICRFGHYGNRDDRGLGFSHATSIAADSDYAFVGDEGNRRLVRVVFTYAAEAEAAFDVRTRGR